VRVQREGAQLQAQGTWSSGEGDAKDRFLADLRGLRDTAALEFDELAARAHYPSDVLQEAECGPSLPSLPILAAYVRACDGDVPEWEERWRRLGFESRADPSLPVRPAGASPAAVAGARAGVGVAPPDAYDPERIRAALRGSHGRSDRGAREAATQAAPRRIEPDRPAAAETRIPESPARWAVGTSWDETTRWDAERGTETVAGWGAGPRPNSGGQPSTSWDGFQRDAGARGDGAVADLTGTPTNGNHHVSQPGGGSSGIETPDAARADSIRRDPFSADWLRDREPTPPPAAESARPAEIVDEPSAATPDSWFTPRETPDHEGTRDAEPSPGGVDAWFTARERADSGLSPTPPAPTPPAPTPPAPTPPAEVERPGPPVTEGHAIARATWREPAETPASDAPGAADRTMPVPVQAAPIPVQAASVPAQAAPVPAQAAPVPAQAAAVPPPRTKSGPAVPAGPVVPPSRSRSDRLYLVRLLVVIVVAALIGSILVLLLR
jgi:hypothetical protein